VKGGATPRVPKDKKERTRGAAGDTQRCCIEAAQGRSRARKEKSILLREKQNNKRGRRLQGGAQSGGGKPSRKKGAAKDPEAANSV